MKSFGKELWNRLADYQAYRSGARDYGTNLRELTLANTKSDAENIIREAYMCKQVAKLCEEGFKINEIAMVVGAFHIEGIEKGNFLSDEEFNLLKKVEQKRL